MGTAAPQGEIYKDGPRFNAVRRVGGNASEPRRQPTFASRGKCTRASLIAD